MKMVGEIIPFKRGLYHPMKPAGVTPLPRYGRDWRDKVSTPNGETNTDRSGT